MAPYTYFGLFIFLVALSIHQSKSVSLDPKYTCVWNIKGSTLYLKGLVKTKGWVGIGLNKKPLMEGAAMAVFGHKDGKPYLYNVRASGHTPPVPGNNKNFQLMKIAENGTHTSFLIRRPLATGDSKDVTIHKGAPLHLLWAIGDNDAISATNFAIHSSRGASKHVFYK